MAAVVEVAAAATDELEEAMRRLIPQLSKSNPAPTRAELDEMVASDAITMFVARDGEGGPIIGTLTLATFRIPTGLRAWIEDVVVDGPAVRGRGLRTGEALTLAAVEAARAAGAKTVDLTSRPSRAEANELYRRLGFEPRETNVYRLDLGAS